MRCSDRRPGFTVAEVTVAVLIAVNVLVILWQVFIADQKRFARDQGKLSSMQSALLFAERFEGELREIALGAPDPQVPDKPFTWDQPLVLGDSNRRVTFLRCVPSDPKVPLVAIEQITYAFDPAQNRMIRGVNGANAWMKNLVVETVQFYPKQVTPNIGALGLSAPVWVFRPDLPILLLKYLITACPDTPGGRPLKEVPPDHKFTLINTVPITHRVERTNYPYWSSGASEQMFRP